MTTNTKQRYGINKYKWPKPTLKKDKGFQVVSHSKDHACPIFRHTSKTFIQKG